MGSKAAAVRKGLSEQERVQQYPHVLHKWWALRGIYSPACGDVPGRWLSGCGSRLKLCCAVAKGARAGEPVWLWFEVCQCCHRASLVPQPELAWSRAANCAIVGLPSLPSAVPLADCGECHCLSQASGRLSVSDFSLLTHF